MFFTGRAARASHLFRAADEHWPAGGCEGAAVFISLKSRLEGCCVSVSSGENNMAASMAVPATHNTVNNNGSPQNGGQPSQVVIDEQCADAAPGAALSIALEMDTPDVGEANESAVDSIITISGSFSDSDAVSVPWIVSAMSVPGSFGVTQACARCSFRLSARSDDSPSRVMRPLGEGARHEWQQHSVKGCALKASPVGGAPAVGEAARARLVN